MKVGDLVRVRYSVKNAYDRTLDGWGEDHIGIVTETAACHDNAIYQMWCISTGRSHVLMPDIDLIEVVSEGGRSNKD